MERFHNLYNTLTFLKIIHKAETYTTTMCAVLGND